MAKSTGKQKSQKETYGTYQKRAVLQVYLSKEEKELVESKAKAENKSVSNYIRILLGLEK